MERVCIIRVLLFTFALVCGSFGAIKVTGKTHYEVLYGTEVTLICTFSKTTESWANLNPEWMDSHGAKIGNSKPDEFELDNPPNLQGNSFETKLIIKKNDESTFYKCELQPVKRAENHAPVPEAYKVYVNLYKIEGENRATIKATSVVFMCKFSSIRHDPTEIYWELGSSGQKVYVKGKPGSVSGYEANAPDTGAIDYSTDSWALTTTLSVDGGVVTDDTSYTCAIITPDGHVKSLSLNLDVFKVQTEYVEVKTGTEVSISCVFTNSGKILDIYWMLGKGSKRFNQHDSQNYKIVNTQASGSQTSTLTIPRDINAYSADYYCSVLDGIYYRDTVVEVRTFSIAPIDQVYQVNISVTLSCVVTNLRRQAEVEWLDKDDSTFTSSSPGEYQVDSGTYDTQSNEQTTTFTIPADLNAGTANYRCRITPGDVKNGGGGTSTRIVPGEASVTLQELVNTGYQCTVASIRSLQAEGKADSSGKYIPIPCFEILQTSTIYPVYSTQQYVSEGNNMEVKPLPIIRNMFDNNFVYRCKGAGGWDRTPPGCSYANIQSSMPGSCSTEGLFHPVIYRINSPTDLDIFSGKYKPDYSTSSDPPLYYSYVPNGQVINYTIANTDCYRFTTDQPNEHYTTTCKDGRFDPPIENTTRICCSYPKFSYILNSDMAKFCVEAVPTASGGVKTDPLSKEKYIKEGITVKFDKKCPCFSMALDNVTCSSGYYHSNYWNVTDAAPQYSGENVTVNGKRQMKLGDVFELKNYCCKLRDSDNVEGYPVSNYTGVQYVTLGSVVSYTCTGYCYLIKTGPITCTADTPHLEFPYCKRNPYCCLDANYTNSFLKDSKQIMWTVMQSSGRQVFPHDTNKTLATRKCVHGIWDLVKYKTENINVDDTLIDEAINKISDQNCSVLVNLVSLNLSKTYYSTVLQQFYNHSFSLSNSNVTTRHEKESCYQTMRYIMWDYLDNKYLQVLDQLSKNKVIIATAKVLNEWVKLMSGSIKAVYTYGAVKIKPKAAALSGSRLIFSGWMIDIAASSYVDSSFIYAFSNVLFPDTKRSKIISPVVWTDLPLNASLNDGSQYITLKFQYSRPLNPQRYYFCAVYDIGTWFGGDLNRSSVKDSEARWIRGSCSNVSVSIEKRTVSCTCKEWKQYIAVTESINSTNQTLAQYLVGNSSSELFLQASNIVHATVILPIALTFLLLIKADTKRKELIQCRLQICFGTVGSNLLSLIAYWMKPSNISCVYIMYLYDGFSIGTMCWFCVEFFCITRFIAATSDKEKLPGKKFCFKFVPAVLAVALLTPTGFVAAYKAMGLRDGPKEFVEPFDSQKCWFNTDMEFYEYFAATFLFAAIALAGLIATVVFSVKEKAMKMEVAGSAIVYVVVTMKNLAAFFRGTESVRILCLVLEATQSIVLLICYVGMSIDVKKSLFPGFYMEENGEDKKKLVGH